MACGINERARGGPTGYSAQYFASKNVLEGPDMSQVKRVPSHSDLVRKIFVGAQEPTTARKVVEKSCEASTLSKPYTQSLHGPRRWRRGVMSAADART